MSESEKIQERFKVLRADVMQCVEKFTEDTGMSVIGLSICPREFRIEAMVGGLRLTLATMRQHSDGVE